MNQPWIATLRVRRFTCAHYRVVVLSVKVFDRRCEGATWDVDRPRLPRYNHRHPYHKSPSIITMRIASLLPSATEIVCALGLADGLVGVSHECDYPPEVVADLPKLTASAIPPGLSSAEVDRAVSERLRRGDGLYNLDEEKLAALRPDLLITQELCDVCAVSFSQVQALARRLPV